MSRLEFLQSSAGNRAVLDLLRARQRPEAAVRRCGPVPCDCPSEHGSHGHQIPLNRFVAPGHGAATSDGPGQTATEVPTLSGLLVRGSRGPQVRSAQRMLNAAEGASLALDGIFGPLTEEAVHGFQSRHELAVDGIIGPSTWGALHELAGPGGVLDLPIQLIKTIFVLAPPPPIEQGPCDCWAAAAASFLNVTLIRPGTTREELNIRFHPPCTDDAGCLMEVHLEDVYGELGIDVRDPPDPFDYNTARQLLQSRGHFIVMGAIGGDFGHAVVVYGVGVGPDGSPSRGHYSAWDPQEGAYVNLAFEDADPVYIGVRTEPGEAAACRSE